MRSMFAVRWRVLAVIPYLLGAVSDNADARGSQRIMRTEKPDPLLMDESSHTLAEFGSSGKVRLAAAEQGQKAWLRRDAALVDSKDIIDAARNIAEKSRAQAEPGTGPNVTAEDAAQQAARDSAVAQTYVPPNVSLGADLDELSKEADALLKNLSGLGANGSVEDVVKQDVVVKETGQEQVAPAGSAAAASTAAPAEAAEAAGAAAGTTSVATPAAAPAPSGGEKIVSSASSQKVVVRAEAVAGPNGMSGSGTGSEGIQKLKQDESLREKHKDTIFIIDIVLIVLYSLGILAFIGWCIHRAKQGGLKMVEEEDDAGDEAVDPMIEG